MAYDNAKFVRYNDSNTSKTPMETMSQGRIYVILDKNNNPKAITFYDDEGKRNKQIDIKGLTHTIDGEKFYHMII